MKHTTALRVAAVVNAASAAAIPIVSSPKHFVPTCAGSVDECSGTATTDRGDQNVVQARDLGGLIQELGDELGPVIGSALGLLGKTPPGADKPKPDNQEDDGGDDADDNDSGEDEDYTGDEGDSQSAVKRGIISFPNTHIGIPDPDANDDPIISSPVIVLTPEPHLSQDDEESNPQLETRDPGSPIQDLLNSLGPDFLTILEELGKALSNPTNQRDLDQRHGFDLGGTFQ